MAEQVFWKIWSLVLSSIAILSTNVAANTQHSRENIAAKISQLPFLRKSEKSDYFLEQTSVFDEDMSVAGHRSHSSHRSHASHYSSAGGSSSRTPSESVPESSEPKQVVPSPTSPQPKGQSSPTPKSNIAPTAPAPKKYDLVRKVYLHKPVALDNQKHGELHQKCKMLTTAAI